MVLLSTLLAPRAYAASVEMLLMPGKVSQAHVKQEPTCAQCHDRSNRRTQTALCLDCHKDVAADLREHRGYHGHVANAGSSECRSCHTEHKGREAKIVNLSRTQFDHRLTDFPLAGAHRTLGCDSCHKPNEAFRKAVQSCAGCHKGDDVHHGQMSQFCDKCHSQDSWADAKFDHATTNFKLTGAHRSVTCSACHVGGNYKSTPTSCVGCHATDDEHRGSRGKDCGKCHVTEDWKRARYDHLKETGYELLGVHAQADCVACHRSGNYKEKIPKVCSGCHQADDAHARRFGDNCADCHNNDKWRVADYAHEKKHKFALVGAHAKIDCYACHSASVKVQKLGTDCNSCHRSIDPHAGKLNGDCVSCHGQNSWRTDILFDHDLTRYPLLGLHRVVSCAQCHSTLAFGRVGVSCNDCHAAEDVHQGGLGKKCESCHTPNGWRLWVFDHGKQTQFPLLGAHAKLKCADCHREPPGSTKTSQTCISCHRKDDRHLGQYGAQCERCHTTYAWKGARIQ
jgi:hypothetical protein